MYCPRPFRPHDTFNYAGLEPPIGKDSTWLTPAGDEMTPQHWEDASAKCFGLLLDGRAPMSGIRKRGSEATLLVIFNSHHDVVVFKLPEAAGGRDWLRLVDTNLPEEDDDDDAAATFKFGHSYEVTGRSLLLFLLRPARARRRVCGVLSLRHFRLARWCSLSLGGWSPRIRRGASRPARAAWVVQRLLAARW
jgi:hypothetical protein